MEEYIPQKIEPPKESRASYGAGKMADNYNPQQIEKKWQEFWERQGFYQAEDFSKKPKQYILIETDCPYLTPPIGENQRISQRKSAAVRNEPLYLKYIAEKIAKIKNLSYEEIAEITTKNAKKLFNF